MTKFNYEAVPFGGYWWIIRTFAEGKFSRLSQHLDKASADGELDALRKMVAKQTADAEAAIEAHQNRRAPTLAEQERQWIRDNGWSGKQ